MKKCFLGNKKLMLPLCVLAVFIISILFVSAPQLLVYADNNAGSDSKFLQSRTEQTNIFLSMSNIPDKYYEAYIAGFSADDEYKGEMMHFSFGSDGDVLITDEQGIAEAVVDIPQDALYAISFDYRPEGNTLLPTILSLTINGETPFRELSTLQANNIWEQGDFPLDRYGNESIPMPTRKNDWQNTYLRPVTGSYSQPMLVYLTKGSHTLTLECNDGAVTVSSLYIGTPPKIEEAVYDEPVGNEIIVIEAERIDRRNNPNIHTNGEFNTSITPIDPKIKLQNYIDDDSYRYGGGIVEYDIYVPADGFYKAAFHYRQGSKSGFNVFRNIYIDGKIPSENFLNVPFSFNRSFSYTSAPGSVYLTEGYHTIGVEVSLDYVSNAVKVLEQVIREMNDLSLQIAKITGGNTDQYRDFALDDYGIDAETMLLYWADITEEIYNALNLLRSGNGKSGEIEPIMTVSSLLRILAEKPNDLPKRLNEFSYGASSARQFLTSAVESLQFSQLGLDKIVLYQSEKDLPRRMGFFSRLATNLSNFFHSFGAQDYTPEYSGTEGESVQIWVSRPRQYLEIMQRMADSDFTEKTGIKVDLSIMPDQSKLILANAAGKAPDAAIAIASGNVYDLAVRGALHNMREFDNFKEVASRFAQGMLIPGVCDDGIYAIPETFNFWVLYYRSDILENLGLEVPDSMDDVRDMLPQLQRMGMNFNSHVSNFVAKPLSATMPFIFQNGGLLFDPDTGFSAIDSAEAVEALTILTENYNVYNMPFSIQSFYQYFRDGRTPIGVSDYGTFNLLTNAAPELAGNWGVALYPGIVDENGEVQRWTSGAAESNVIFQSSSRKDEAWQFVDWWMSADVQTEFAFTLQTTLGNEFMWNSANIEAIENSPWNRKHKEVIIEQMKWTYEPPRIPGSYMAERNLSNIVNAVVSDGGKLQNAIDDAHKTINREIRRKLEEFGYTKDGVFVKQLTLPTMESLKEWLE